MLLIYFKFPFITQIILKNVLHHLENSDQLVQPAMLVAQLISAYTAHFTWALVLRCFPGKIGSITLAPKLQALTGPRTNPH